MKRKIQLVDDDRDLVSMLKLILEHAGYEVSTAASGDEAMKAIDNGLRPDAIILDIMMSGRGDGIIFARKVRKIDAVKDVPILMLTGMRQVTGYRFIEEDPRDPLFLPVDIFLEKPVLPEVLLSNLEKLLLPKVVEETQQTAN